MADKRARRILERPTEPLQVIPVGNLVSVGDTRLYVAERGSGYPVLVLHGGPGADHTQLDGYLDPLTDAYKLVLVDQRAQGRSDEAAPDTWTIPQAASDVSALATELGLSDYAVLGHSYGALVALQHAATWPGSAAQTIVSHGVPSLRWYRLKEELDRFEPEPLKVQIAQAWETLDACTSSEEAASLIAAQTPFHFRDPLDPRIADFNRRQARMIHSPRVNRHFSANAVFDVEDRLSSITQPVLILTGRHERTCPAQASEFMTTRIPNATLVVFERSAHVSYAEENEAYLASVRSFLDQHPADPAA